MANSKIILWQTGLKAADNMIIERIWNFLDTSGVCVACEILEDFQYIKPDYEITLKLAKAQEEITEQHNPDYLSIEEDGHKWYYYIDSVEQTSANTLKYKCHLDVLNTFEGNYELTDKSMIEREHVDRFTKKAAQVNDDIVTASYVINRSKTKENLEPKLYKVSDVTISGLSQKLDDKKWYLIYRTSNTTGSSGTPCIDLVANEDVALLKLPSGVATLPEGITPVGTDGVNISQLFFNNNQSRTYVITLDDWTAKITPTNPIYAPTYNLTNGTLVMRFASASGRPTSINIDYIAPNGDVTAIGPYFSYTIQQQTVYYGVASIELHSSNAKYLLYDETASFKLTDILKNPVTWTKRVWILGNSVNISGINSLNRTDSTIVKVIECPYCPIEFTYNVVDKSYSWPDYWEYTNDGSMSFLRTTNLNVDFTRTNIWQRTNISEFFKGQLSIQKELLSYPEYYHFNDPKIYNNATYKESYVYDSNEYVLPIEDYDYTYSSGTITDINISYKQSNAVSSDLAFRFKASDNTPIKGESTFNDVLLSNRNNELVLFTSDYLNYMKNGYNYDKEKMKQQATQNAASIATKAASSAAAMAVAGLITGSAGGVWGAAIGGTIGLVSGAISAGLSNKQAESDLEQKINELQNKAYAVSFVNDRDLFNWYSDNKLHYMKFEPSVDNKELISRYYELYGYSAGYIKKPDMDSRYFYNYVRGDVDIDGLDYQPFLRFKDMLIQRYKEGVYKIHNRQATSWVWDIDLNHGNVEINLLPTLWVISPDDYQPLDANWLSDLEVDDRNGFSCRYDGPYEINNRTRYVEFEFYSNGLPIGRPDESGSTLFQFTTYQPGSTIRIRVDGQYQYSGALLRARIVDSTRPWNTSAWKTLII